MFTKFKPMTAHARWKANVPTYSYAPRKDSRDFVK